MRIKVKVDNQRVMIPVSEEKTVEDFVSKISARLPSLGFEDSQKVKSICLGGYDLFGKDCCGDVLKDGDEVEAKLEVESSAHTAASTLASASEAAAVTFFDCEPSSSERAGSHSTGQEILVTIYPSSGREVKKVDVTPSTLIADLHGQVSAHVLPKGVDKDDFEVYLCTSRGMLLFSEDEMRTCMLMQMQPFTCIHTRVQKVKLASRTSLSRGTPNQARLLLPFISRLATENWIFSPLSCLKARPQPSLQT